MKIKWFNVSSFMITTDNDARIITDPFQYNYLPEGDPPPGFNPDRPGIAEKADVVAISHSHFDHSYVGAGNVQGIPRLYTGGASREFKGVKFSSIAAYHDSRRGLVNLIGIDADGIRIRHMGDYGQDRLYDEQLELIGSVDILMTPWGDWTPALLSQLKPKVVLPMHHARVDQVKGLKGFTDLTDKSSELEFKADSLPSEMKIVMLKSSRESNL